ncbi:hypothetical protein Agub_g9389 [Astrephomene gubernaculifera]|uniref:Peptidoglycan binding-like domain-containing protein n=1 Tax=Astrephomene gubernaculifera TaxID=47775 RepID=A0AAD3HP18_9CHLO|nr:hypothetical protein Agub_g9389 [Astrephomene gubernaculifera]
MLAFRSLQPGTHRSQHAHYAHGLPNPSAVVSQQPFSLLAHRGRRDMVVAVFAKKDHKEYNEHHDDHQLSRSSAELQAYAERERYLMSELSKAHSQVDKLLDQQQLLLNMVARLSGVAGPLAQQPDRNVNLVPPAAVPLPTSLPPSGGLEKQSPGAAFISAAAAAVPATSAVQFTRSSNSISNTDNGVSTTATTGASVSNNSNSAGSSGTSSGGSSFPTSLSEFFRSAAAAAPHPASAAAAASVAAAIAAVDTSDILSLGDFPLPETSRQRSPLPPPSPQQRQQQAQASAQQDAASAPHEAARSTSPPQLQQPSLLFNTLGGFITTSITSSSNAQSSSSPSPGESAAAPVAGPAAAVSGGGAAGADLAQVDVEVAKAAPTDPPPELVQGDDDIYWLSRLHAALEQRGFYPGEEDMENWFFGETTQAAVLAFQASVRLPETGVVDRPTWTALLGEAAAGELYDRGAAAEAAAVMAAVVTAVQTAESGDRSGDGASTRSPPPVSPPPVSSDAVSAAAPPPPASSSSSSSAAAAAATAATAAGPPAQWPVLMEGDGGREVHALQVALCTRGFHCGEEDMRWWQLGEDSATALRYFQSCNGLPESGVCDERTWRALLGPAAQPADLYDIRLAANSDDEEGLEGGFEEDMEGVSRGRVWLLGEQRWERRA